MAKNRYCLRFIPFLAAAMLAAEAHAQPRLTGSFLPQERNVEAPNPATMFATLVNYGNETATNCRPQWIAHHSNPGGSTELHYYLLDDASAIVGERDPAIELAPGQAQQLLIAIEPGFYPSGSPRPDLVSEGLGFVCDNAAYIGYERHGIIRAGFHLGDEADVIAIGSTLSGDQVMRAPAAGRRAVMAVAAVNIGATQRLGITAWSTLYPIEYDFYARDGIELTVCETDAQARCLAEPTSELLFDFAAGQVRTFNIYARATEPEGVPLQPAYNRVHVTIEPPSEVTGQIGHTWRSMTSAAFYSPPESDLPVPGIWRYLARPDLDPDNPYPPNARFEGEIYVVPRAEQWADDGTIVIMQDDIDPRTYESANLPDIGLQIEWENPYADGRVISFDPHVELAYNASAYRYYYPDAAPPSGNLNFRSEDRGGGVVSGRWVQFWRHTDCSSPCPPSSERLYRTFELAGRRTHASNNFSFTDLPVDWVEAGTVNPVTRRRLSIRADGTFEGEGHFYRNNFGGFFLCPFNGRIYDTVPGSPLFYVRLTVPESARCETPGYPPIAPFIEDDYEGILVLSPDVHLGRNVLVHRFYVWTMKHFAPDIDLSNQAMFEFPIPAE